MLTNSISLFTKFNLYLSGKRFISLFIKHIFKLSCFRCLEREDYEHQAFLVRNHYVDPNQFTS
jgi:hypothetical protein